MAYYWLQWNKENIIPDIFQIDVDKEESSATVYTARVEKAILDQTKSVIIGEVYSILGHEVFEGSLLDLKKYLINWLLK